MPPTTALKKATSETASDTTTADIPPRPVALVNKTG